MKMTIISNSQGEVVGSVQGGCSQDGIVARTKTEQPPYAVGIMPGPDQRFTEIEVPDELAACDAKDLYERLQQYLCKCR